MDQGLPGLLAGGQGVPSQEQLLQAQQMEQQGLLALHGQTPVADHYQQQMVAEQPNHEAAQEQGRSAANWGTLGGGLMGAAWPMIGAANPVTGAIGLGLGAAGSGALGMSAYHGMGAHLDDRQYQKANAINQNFQQNGPAAQMPMNYAGAGSQPMMRGLLSK